MRQTLGRSDVLAMRKVAPELTGGRSKRNSKVTEASIRGEYNKDGWVICNGVVTLFWWFSAEVVSSLASSVGVI